jgi:BirA family transcriptional regulator, biotin operon repressor / biotin---[acetyl-CoA-carboxylase] ligase
VNGNVKYELLKRLQQAGGEPLSGQQIATELDISRTAIWKHINQLKDEGYHIETVHKKGYILKQAADVLHPEKIQAALKTEHFGRVIHYEEQLDSTQPVAHKLAQEGAADGTVVICETQTLGRGRLLRPWHSEKGKGIWMSVILRPDVPTHKAPQFTLVAAVAVTRAIRDIAGIAPEIKWPNDLLINGLKCTGILTEMQADPDGVNALIMGIGINVNHEQADFSDDIQSIATSLKLAAGHSIDRAELVAHILYYLEMYSAKYVDEGFKDIKREWELYSCTLGNRVRATTTRDVFVGEATELTDDGVLKIRLDNGEVKGVYSADITLEN